MTYKLVGQEQYQIPTNADLGSLAYQNSDALAVGQFTVANTATISGLVAPLTVAQTQAAAGTYLLLTQVPSNLAVGQSISGTNIPTTATVASFLSGFQTTQPTYAPTTATVYVAMTSTYGIVTSMAAYGTGITYGTSVSSISNSGLPVAYSVTTATTVGSTTLYVGTTTGISVNSMVFGTNVDTGTRVLSVGTNAFVTISAPTLGSVNVSDLLRFAPSVTLSQAIAANTLTQNILFYPVISLSTPSTSAILQNAVVNTYFNPTNATSAALVVQNGGLGVTGQSWFANSATISVSGTAINNQGTHLTIANPSGTQSSIGFTFAGSPKASIRIDNGGNFLLNSLTGNFYFNNDLSSNSTLQFLNASQTFLQVTGTTATIVGNTIINTSTAASNTATGALQVRGGAGIWRDLWVGGNINVAGTITGAGSISTATNLASGTTGAIPYQISPGITGFIAAASTASWLLTSDGTTSTWAPPAPATTPATPTVAGVVFGYTSSTCYNTSLGFCSGNTSTTGFSNFASGYRALTSNTTGYGNTAIGWCALTSNYGCLNTAIGYLALQCNTAGHSNIAVGYSTLAKNIGGYRNTALGYTALSNNTYGHNNFAAGSNALNCNVGGCYNVAIGSGALGANSYACNGIAIGNSALSSNTFGQSNIALGCAALRFNTTGCYNVAIGYGALGSNITGSGNFAVGTSALCMNCGSGNIGLGNQALSCHTTGDGNFAAGCKAMYGASTGAQNVVIGPSAMQLGGGCDNIALGYAALYRNCGSGNIGLGYQTLQFNATGNGNTAIGCCALYNNTASNNIAIGYSSLYSNTAGCNNIAIGCRSGCAITTGSHNVIIGSSSGSNYATASCNIVLSDGLGNERIITSNTGSTYIPSTLASTSSLASNALYVAGGVAIGTSLYVTGPAVFQNNVTFAGTSTTVNSTNTIYTDNILELHYPSTGTTWTVADGRDIGLRFHYYNGGDQNAALVLAADTNSLEWYQTGVEDSTSTIKGAYGNFKTGSIQLTSSTVSASTITGALVVAGGAGIGGNTYVGGNVVGSGPINVFGDLATSSTFNVNATRSLNLIGAGAVMRVGRTNGSGDPAVELLNLDATTGAVLTWWDFYTIGDTFNVRRRTSSTGDNMATFAMTGSAVNWAPFSITTGSNATSTTTGALRVAGGVGIGGALWAGTTSYIAGAQILTTATVNSFVTAGVSSITAGTDTAVSTTTGAITLWDTSTLQSVTSRGATTNNPVVINNSITLGSSNAFPLNLTGSYSNSLGAAINATGISQPSGTGYWWDSQFTLQPTTATVGTFYGLLFLPTLGNTATYGTIYGNFSRLDMNASATTGSIVSNWLGYNSATPSKNVAAQTTVTTHIGFRAEDPGSAITPTNVYGYQSQITTSTGVNKWNVYASGSAPSYFNGNVSIGSTNAAFPLDVTGNAKIAGNLTVTGTVNGNVSGASTTATNLAGGTAGQVPFQTAPGVTNFTSTLTITGNVVNITGNVPSTNNTSGSLVVTGGVGISGALNATTKSFNIAHPTKPGMSLRYGSLEGPEFGVYVRGRLNGDNKIILPDYWSKLVNFETITVDITPVGKYQKLFVKDITDGIITIGNDALLSNAVNCFYTVFAERADVDKLQVEGE